MDASQARGGELLSVSDARLPALPFVLDPAYLGEVLGAPVRIERVRYKPGESIVAAVRTSEGAARTLWVAGYTDEAPDKLEKVAVRAWRTGAQFFTRDVPGASPGSVIGFGEPSVDRELYKTFRWWRRHGGDGAKGGGSDRETAVLRYNPHRRIVLRVEGDAGAMAVKLIPAGSAHASRVLEVVERVTPRAPVAEFIRPGSGSVTHAASRGVTATAWWGDGELSMPDTPVARRHDAARAAGRALADIHSTPWGDVAASVAGSASPVHLQSRHLRAIARNRTLLNGLVPDQRAHIDSVAQRLAARLITATENDRRGDEERLAIVHGDFSSDQVLLGHAGGIRLLDFDRARAGFPEEDLGSFAAVELVTSGERALTESLLDGYGAEARSEWGVRGAVWEAYSLFTRAAEPFRRQDLGWQKRISEALALVERSLS